jgi:hypothetical protein
MASSEAQAARRRAELLRQQMRKAESKDTTHRGEQAAAERPAVDAKTARLRMLRLAKEAEERAAADAGGDKGRMVRAKRAKVSPA